MTFLLGLTLGLVVGTAFGFFTMGLLVAATRPDDDIDWDSHNDIEWETHVGGTE